MVIWPLETVTLVDCAQESVDDWTGYLVPAYISGFPNSNAAARYTLEFECGLIWILGVGDLKQRVWDALMVHEAWCKRTTHPSADQSPRNGANCAFKLSHCPHVRITNLSITEGTRHMSLAEILHELVDAAHIARTITDNRRAELHQAVTDLEQLATSAEAPAPATEQTTEQPTPTA